MSVTVLGKTFETEEERREYFREELRKKLPELKKIEGFPIGEDEDIIELSDPPYYTACPNPWLNDFIEEWEGKKNINSNYSREENVLPYSGNVSVGKNNPIYRAHTYHTKVPHPAIMRYILHYTKPGDIVFDGFAGTGMTGVAASMCEAPDEKLKKEIENEFSKNNYEDPEWGKRESICVELSPLASFVSSIYNSKPDLKNSFQNVEKKLAASAKDFNKYYLTHHSDGKRYGKINYVVWSEVFICPNCTSEFSYWEVAVRLSENKILKNFSCPDCSSNLNKRDVSLKETTVFDKSLNKTREVVEFEPVLINYSIDGNRHEKEPDKNDLKIIEEIKKLSKSANKKHKIYNGDEIGRLSKYNFENIRDLFFDRVRLVYDQLLKSKSRELLFLLTAAAQNNSMLYRFRLNGKGGTTSGTYYICSTPQENNPFNSFKYKLRDIKKALKLSSGYSVIDTSSSTDVRIKSNSIDYIFTDPPFGSNLMYSELNLIMETWLDVITNSEEEAITNKSQAKSADVYNELIKTCFSEFYRILKPGKWMTVEFSNTSAAVWNGIQNAIQKAGFIIANVAALDKKQGSFKAVNTVTAVKQDLVISCYKPSPKFEADFKTNKGKKITVWDFTEEHLSHLPVHLQKESSTTAIVERSPKILYDRLVAFYVQKGYSVPLDASKFQVGLRERFIERDGMFFTNEQVQEYDRKKAEVPNFTQLSILVASEQDGVLWLQNFLKDEPKTYQDIQPEWMQALGGERKGDIIPELKTILEENFLKNDAGEWYVPDPDKEEDLEKLRNRRLLKQFEEYREQAFKPKGKIKECRVEALRAGFKQCYQDKDFETIVRVGDRIPENLLMEDEVLLQFYDIAESKG